MHTPPREATLSKTGEIELLAFIVTLPLPFKTRLTRCEWTAVTRVAAVSRRSAFLTLQQGQRGLRLYVRLGEYGDRSLLEDGVLREHRTFRRHVDVPDAGLRSCEVLRRDLQV